MLACEARLVVKWGDQQRQVYLDKLPQRRRMALIDAMAKIRKGA
jgi:hypothetical protein